MQRSASSSDSLTKRALRGVLRLVFRLSITGDPASFHNERTLIVANHESFLDGLLLALFLPVRATFVVHTEVVKNSLFRRLLTLIPHVVVDSASPMAIKVICKLVESGEPVAIFPEGRLTVTGSLMNGLRRGRLRRSKDGRDDRAGANRRCGPKLLWTSRGNLSAEIIPENQHLHSHPAKYPNAAAGVSQAAP